MASKRLHDAKGRNWFGLFADVRQHSYCAQIATLLSAVVRDLMLSIVGFAVNSAGKNSGSPPSR